MTLVPGNAASARNWFCWTLYDVCLHLRLLRKLRYVEMLSLRQN